MGLESYASAVADERLMLIGDTGLESDMLDWLSLSRYAEIKKQVA
jgi:hypothetical protein